MADEPKRINFYKIVENALSLVVVSVFMGACAIVWRGATTVDSRVNETKQDLNMLINNLSMKLSSYEVQLKAQSNQIDAVYTELKTIKPLVLSAEAWRTNRWNRTNVPVVIPVLAPEQIQRVLQQDIQQELLKK